MVSNLLGRQPVFAAVVITIAIAAGCTKEIPGNPEKVLKEYLAAIQENNFDTAYRLNRITARQMLYMEKGAQEGGNRAEFEQNYNKHKTDFDNVTPSFDHGARWVEKFFFPKSAKLDIGKPRMASELIDDPVNRGIEKGQFAIISVRADYQSPDSAPLYEGKSLKSATYECSMNKIRGSAGADTHMVQIYEADSAWFFSGCFVLKDSVQFF